MKNFIVFIIIFFGKNIFAQLIQFPAYDNKSHQTLDIVSIELDTNQTVFHMKLKNELEDGGWFCVDKEVVLSFNDGGQNLKMNRISGIEKCPDLHKFSYAGEEIEFDLFFPGIPKNVERIDLVENCNDNCFIFKGICLNIELNSEIRKFEDALALYRTNDGDKALNLFIDIRDNSKFHNEKPFGYSAYIIPVIYYNMKNGDKAKEAFNILKSLEMPEKEYFISKLKEMEFFKSL